MLLFRSYPVAVAVLIIALTSGVGLAPHYLNEKPYRSQSVSDDVALWLLVQARARLSGNQNEIAAQQVMPHEAKETRDTTLFVTPYSRGCVICPTAAVGMGDSLAAALNSALSKIPASVVSSRGVWPPAESIPYRIQIDVLDGSLTPLAKPELDAPRRQTGGADLIDPGVEGLAVETDGRILYMLPLEMLYRSVFDEDPGAQSADDVLNRAMKHMGLDERAWRSPRITLSRFRTISFVEDRSRGSALRLIRGSIPPLELTRGRLVASARAGGDYLVRMQRPDGVFRYSYDPVEDRVSRRAYNMLSMQAPLSLFDLYNAVHDVRYLDSARRAVAFLKTRFRPSDKRTLFVLDDDGKAKLGANGLALLALVTQAELDPQSGDRSSAERLANQIVVMQHKDGSFQTFIRFAATNLKEAFSLYYPGEAIAGWCDCMGLNGDARLLVRQGAGPIT
jgi:hypothetical protein